MLVGVSSGPPATKLLLGSLLLVGWMVSINDWLMMAMNDGIVASKYSLVGYEQEDEVY